MDGVDKRAEEKRSEKGRGTYEVREDVVVGAAVHGDGAAVHVGGRLVQHHCGPSLVVGRRRWW